MTSYTFANVTDDHTIRVTFSINSYAITATAAPNGTISPTGTVYVTYGSNQQFTITPATGYHVDSVIVDGSKVDSTTSYTFVNVTASHTIRTTYKINSYTITATAGSNGTISPTGTVYVTYGSNQQFTITPATGYHVDSVIVDGSRVDSTTSYTFISDTTAHTIRTTFKINRYTITASAGPNGSITPSGSVNMDYGSSQIFAFTPSTSYHVDSVYVDGIGQAFSASTDTVKNVTTNHTVLVTFAINTYTVISTAGNHGSVSPSGTTTVNYGANQAFTFTPSTGYHIDSVYVDGIGLAYSAITDTIKNVTTNHTVLVTFAINTFTLISTAGSHGSVSPTGDTTVNYGTNQAFTFTPSTGYHVDSVYVDSVGQAYLATTDTIRNVTTNHKIRVTFAINHYAITAIASSHGTISPPDSVNISYGGNQIFTIAPDPDYRIDSVVVDGARVDSTTSYTFINVTAAQMISAYFSLDLHTLLLSFGSKWNIVSLPVRVSDSSKTTLFPNAVSNAFAYQGSYVPKTSLSGGVGYWLKFDSAQQVGIIGLLLKRDTTNVMRGWNMIGSISTAVPVTAIGSLQSGLIASKFFGYSKGYYISDTIRPGNGYWVKVSEAGKLILSSAGLMTAATRIKIVPSAELPPAPPDGGLEDLKRGIPTQFALEQNYPNPFNPTATIQYQLPTDSRVTLKIYNVLGQLVQTLVDGVQSASYQSVEWNAGSAASGIYFYRLEATSTSDPTKSFTQVKKMLMLK